MQNSPMVACLCPTYKRPRLVQNAIALFMMQNYPAHRRQMFIYDDSGSLESGHFKGNIEVFSQQVRSPSITRKMNTLFDMSMEGGPLNEIPDVIVLWDDDDVYLPDHVSASVTALQFSPWAQPAFVYSDYPKFLIAEPSGGRFYASASIRRTALTQINCWEESQRADYDQLFLKKCYEKLGPSAPVRGNHPKPLVPKYPAIHITPPKELLPTFIFRWSSTGVFHAQSAIHSADDLDWYSRYELMLKDRGMKVQEAETPVGVLDSSSISYLMELGYTLSDIELMLDNGGM